MPTGIWLYSYIALWSLLLSSCVLLASAIRQVADLHTYLVNNDLDQGLPIGSPAPPFSSVDLFGRPFSLTSGGDCQTLLLFVTRGCSACGAIMKIVPSMVRIKDTSLVLIISNNDMHTRLFVAEHHREASFPDVPVISDPGLELFEQYRVTATPYLVVINRHGIIGSKGVPPATLFDVERLVDSARMIDGIDRVKPNQVISNVPGAALETSDAAAT